MKPGVPVHVPGQKLITTKEIEKYNFMKCDVASWLGSNPCPRWALRLICPSFVQLSPFFFLFGNLI